ncbi:MAG: hypothetical protein CFE21_15820 [Bacteroidetes bacterium B1(2017)]|nr:MAG: hypothetical protein CFE21_15820 [Bacteroidetes bacterium B1(2017)]
MKKFLAKIVYKIVSGHDADTQQFDEQLVFIDARDYHEAFFKARMLGVKNEDEVNHESGAEIHWKFIDVPFLNEISNMNDGTELYSCISEKERDDSFETFIKARAADLQNYIEKQLIPA